MISTLLKPVLLMTFILFSAVINATQFDNPYQGSVLVGSFDEKALKEMALKQVLVKVSGNADIDSRDETKLLLNQAQQLLSQYGYRKIQGQEYFSAVFDQRKIDQALKDMQQPVWGDTRPITLIWLINNNEIISDNTINQSRYTSLRWALQQAEIARGVRMQFPLMDLDDNLVLSVSDVRGRFYEQVAMASARYSRHNFILAELKATSADNWRLSWQLVQTEHTPKQNSTLISEQFIGAKSEVIKNMVNSIADYYAGQYAILDNPGEKFTQMLHIKGINTLPELAKLNRVLSNLNAISSFNLGTVEGDQLSVEVKIKGGLNSFKNALIVQPNLQLIKSVAVIEEQPIDIEIDQDETLIDDEDKVETVKTEALYFNWR